MAFEMPGGFGARLSGSALVSESPFAIYGFDIDPDVWRSSAIFGAELRAAPGRSSKQQNTLA
jgi:hypothetical protein